jgi:hypothetical protein
VWPLHRTRWLAKGPLGMRLMAGGRVHDRHNVITAPKNLAFETCCLPTSERARQDVRVESRDLGEDVARAKLYCPPKKINARNAGVRS